MLVIWVASWHENEEQMNLVHGNGAGTLADHGGSANALRVSRLCMEDEHGFVMVVVVWRHMKASGSIFRWPPWTVKVFYLGKD